MATEEETAGDSNKRPAAAAATSRYPFYEELCPTTPLDGVLRVRGGPWVPR